MGLRGMIVFSRLGGRWSVGVRGMIVFTRRRARVGVGPWDDSFHSARRRAFFRRHTAATGFGGISTDAALPLSKVASVLSRGFLFSSF